MHIMGAPYFVPKVVLCNSMHDLYIIGMDFLDPLTKWLAIPLYIKGKKGTSCKFVFREQEPMLYFYYSQVLANLGI